MIKKSLNTMYINFRHLLNLGNFDVIQLIVRDYYKFEPVLRSAVYTFMFNLHPQYSKSKNFSISFFNLHEVEDIRALKTDKLGRLL